MIWSCRMDVNENIDCEKVTKYKVPYFFVNFTEYHVEFM